MIKFNSFHLTQVGHFCVQHYQIESVVMKTLNVTKKHFCPKTLQAIGSFTQLKGSMKEPNILIYFFFPPITQSCSVSDGLFTGGRGVSDFSVLK